MKQVIAAFISGLLFAMGLGVSGMTQPGKVMGFLDVFGYWDPSLIFVMIGAVLVYSVGYRFVLKRKAPLFAKDFQIPKLKKVDKQLLLGSLLFGVGWGLVGFCPGPALTSLTTLGREPLIFVASMLAGMSVFALIKK